MKQAGALPYARNLRKDNDLSYWNDRVSEKDLIKPYHKFQNSPAE